MSAEDGTLQIRNYGMFISQDAVENLTLLLQCAQQIAAQFLFQAFGLVTRFLQCTKGAYGKVFHLQAK